MTNALAIAALIQNIAPNLTVETANSLFYAMYFDEAAVLEKSLNDFSKIFDRNWEDFKNSDFDTKNLDQRAEFFDKIKRGLGS